MVAGRSNGVDELYLLVEDIGFVERQVSLMPFCVRRRFRKQIRDRLGSLDGCVSYMIECQHQVYNTAYEDAVGCLKAFPYRLRR